MRQTIGIKNFRNRTRIYPRAYGFPSYYSFFENEIARIEQTNTNFGTQTNVSQNAVINQDNFGKI